MLLTRSTIRAWNSIFRQYPNGIVRIIAKPPPLRCSSSLPKETDPDGETKQELAIPKERWDPVPQRFLRPIPVEHHGIVSSKFNDYTIWQPIYKLPSMGKIYAFVRFKFWLTFLSIGACIFRLTDLLFDFSSNTSLSYAGGAAGVSLLGLCLAGNLCRKLVVQIYVTDDLEYIRLSRFTFAAKRQDIVIPKSLLIPLTESNDTHRKMFLKLETKMPENIDLEYDNYEFYDEKYNIILMFGGINDQEKFEAILGRLLRRIN